jgi:hypothetical protein
MNEGRAINNARFRFDTAKKHVEDISDVLSINVAPDMLLRCTVASHVRPPAHRLHTRQTTLLLNIPNAHNGPKYLPIAADYLCIRPTKRNSISAVHPCGGPGLLRGFTGSEGRKKRRGRLTPRVSSGVGERRGRRVDLCAPSRRAWIAGIQVGLCRCED